MGKMDEIKRKLNLEELNQDERKKLFKDFVDHGGKTIEMDEEEKRIQRVRNSQKDNYKGKKKHSKKEDHSSRNTNSSSHSHSSNNTKKQSPLTKDAILKRNKPSFFQSIGTNLFSYLNRVTNFSGTVLNNKFVTMTTMTFYEMITDVQRIASVILGSKSFEEFDIKYYFFKRYPIYYELLYRIQRLPIKDIIHSIREKEKTAPGFRLLIHDLDKEIYGIFRTLFTFLPYKKKIADAYREGFRIMEKKEKLSPSVVNTYMGTIRRAFSNIFEKYMLKLFYAFLKSTKMNFKINSPELPIFLELNDRDRIGGFQADFNKDFEREKGEDSDEGHEGSKGDNEKNSEEEKLQETEEKLSLPDNVNEGLSIIEEINYNRFGSAKDSPYYYYDKKDKVFRIAAILDFFEREYSFLMTGNKVKYYMEHHEGIKFDPKKEMNEEYVEINSVMDSIREYSQQIKEISNTEDNTNIPAMQKHNLVHKATIQKSKISMSLRAKLGYTLSKIKDTLEKIKTDHKKFLADPDMILRFSDMDKNKRLAGKTPVVAIDEFYDFIVAFQYLATKGNLGGAGNVVR